MTHAPPPDSPAEPPPEAPPDSTDQAPPPRRDPRIAQTLSFALLVAANRIARPFAQRHGRRFGLGLAEWRCMMSLAADPDRSGEDVARAMGMEPMTVSRALHRLERDGRAVFATDPAHRKRKRWRLTDPGWRIVETIAPDALACDAALGQGLAEHEVAQLAFLLRRIGEAAEGGR